MIFNVFGIRIEISFLFVFFITAFIVIESSGVLIFGLGCALLHELGHIMMMVLVGDKPSKVTFNFFDINIKDNKRNKRNYREDVLILLGGPIANFIIGAALWILYVNYGNEKILTLVTENLFLGVFNILPIESLDGGQILYIYLSNKLRQDKAILMLQLISFAVLLPLAILGFYILLISKYNYSLLLVSCYLIGVVLIKRGYFFY